MEGMREGGVGETYACVRNTKPTVFKAAARNGMMDAESNPV